MSTIDYEDTACELAGRLLDAVADRDAERALQCFAEDGVFEMPNRPGGYPRVMNGRAQIGRFLDALPRLFSRLDLENREFYTTTEPRRVIAEYTSDGTAETGKPYRNRYIAVFEFNDQDEVILWREYFDPTIISEAFELSTGRREDATADGSESPTVEQS